MNNKPLYWFVRRRRDDRMLCTDGQWRLNAGAIENIKMWRRSGNLDRHMAKLGIREWDSFALYPGDSIDCLGVITYQSNYKAVVRLEASRRNSL